MSYDIDGTFWQIVTLFKYQNIPFSQINGSVLARLPYLSYLSDLPLPEPFSVAEDGPFQLWDTQPKQSYHLWDFTEQILKKYFLRVIAFHSNGMRLFKFAMLPMKKLLEITKNFLGFPYPFYPLSLIQFAPAILVNEMFLWTCKKSCKTSVIDILTRKLLGSYKILIFHQ